LKKSREAPQKLLRNSSFENSLSLNKLGFSRARLVSYGKMIAYTAYHTKPMRKLLNYPHVAAQNRINDLYHSEKIL